MFSIRTTEQSRAERQGGFATMLEAVRAMFGERANCHSSLIGDRIYSAQITINVPRRGENVIGMAIVEEESADYE